MTVKVNRNSYFQAELWALEKGGAVRWPARRGPRPWTAGDTVFWLSEMYPPTDLYDFSCYHGLITGPEDTFSEGGGGPPKPHAP